MRFHKDRMTARKEISWGGDARSVRGGHVRIVCFRIQPFQIRERLRLRWTAARFAVRGWSRRRHLETHVIWAMITLKHFISRTSLPSWTFAASPRMSSESDTQSCNRIMYKPVKSYSTSNQKYSTLLCILVRDSEATNTRKIQPKDSYEHG